MPVTVSRDLDYPKLCCLYAQQWAGLAIAEGCYCSQFLSKTVAKFPCSTDCPATILLLKLT